MENPFPLSLFGSVGKLSSREWEVVSHLAQGKTYRDVAAALGIGYETVCTHLRHVRTKLGLRTKAAIIVWYLKERENK